MIEICNLRHNKSKYEYDFKRKILSKDKKFRGGLEKFIEVCRIPKNSGYFANVVLKGVVGK